MLKAMGLAGHNVGYMHELVSWEQSLLLPASMITSLGPDRQCAYQAEAYDGAWAQSGPCPFGPLIHPLHCPPLLRVACPVARVRA